MLLSKLFEVPEHFSSRVWWRLKANTYNNTTYFGSPNVNEVEKNTGTKIKPIEITSSAKPNAGSIVNNKLEIYKPEISKSGAVKPSPNKVVNKESLKPVNNAETKKTNVKSKVKPAPQGNKTTKNNSQVKYNERINNTVNYRESKNNSYNNTPSKSTYKNNSQLKP